MPYKSQKQRAYMYAKHPKMAKEFEASTPKGKKLPKYADGPDADAKIMEKHMYGKKKGKK